jgi:hypothetical protein
MWSPPIALTSEERDYSVFTGFWYGSRGVFVV